MKLLLPTLAACVIAYVAATALSNGIVSKNNAYAHVESTRIEWGARVDIAQIEADRDVNIAGIHRDEIVWSSWAWNVGSIIRGLLWVLLSVFVLFLFVSTLKLARVI